MLSDKLAIDTRNVDAQEAAIRILRIVRPDLYEQHPRAELERMASGEAIAELQSEIEELREELQKIEEHREELQEQVAEYQCPHCGAPLVSREHVFEDLEQKNEVPLESFACGLVIRDYMLQHPCASDPNFPSLEDYELVCKRTSYHGDHEWRCAARPTTEMARKLRLDAAYGRSEEEAKRKVKATYLYRAGRMTNQEWLLIQMGDPSSP